LIDQLLALSRFDGDSAQLRAEKTNLVDTCRFFVSQFASYADEAGIDLELHSDETNIEAYIDVESFQIVINNLINNALKFTPAGGSIQFEIYADPATSLDTSLDDNIDGDVDEKNDVGCVHITVTDSGMGISESDLPSIFDRYYLGNNQNENQTSQIGSGVGLALVKEVINHHGGQIHVTSVLQVGTRFEITLPLGKEHLHPSEVVEATRQKFPKSRFKPTHIETSHQEPNQIQENNKLHKVLIVDDNKDMRDYLRGLLEANYEVVEASDGQEGEEVLKIENPSLVITDLMMPVKDGLEFVKSVKQQPSYALTPMIILTAKAGRESRIEGLDAAADDYLEKPFDAKELQARVQNLLLKHQFVKTANAEPEVKNEFLVRLSKAAIENLSSDSFGVEELAQSVYMSSPTLRRKLAACSSLSPSSFLRQQRLEQAKLLIGKGEMRSIAELASAVGFTHTSYFSRLYKKTYGENPRV
jgi:DNA-binding response OmpR family regulator/two-component sensor histidine kinase